MSDSGDLFLITLDEFDGPIDLLLHLVKQNELPIEKLSLGLVAEQYLLCLDNLSNIEVEIAGEYLVIASTLLSIKARYILRQPVEELETADDVFVAEDPHEVLLRRLQEAAVYQAGANELASRPLLGIDVFAAPGITGTQLQMVNPLRYHDPLLLGKALRALVKRKGVSVPPMRLQFDPVSVSDRMQSILHVLTDRRAAYGRSHLDLEELILELVGEADLGILITCFLALLELVRQRSVGFEQRSEFGKLMIFLPVDVSQVVEDAQNL